MLKLSPQSAQGLNKLSNDIRAVSKYYLERRKEKQQEPKVEEQQTEPQTVRYQFSFIDALKICAYFLLTALTVRALFFILNW